MPKEKAYSIISDALGKISLSPPVNPWVDVLLKWFETDSIGKLDEGLLIENLSGKQTYKIAASGEIRTVSLLDFLFAFNLYPGLIDCLNAFSDEGLVMEIASSSSAFALSFIEQYKLSKSKTPAILAEVKKLIVFRLALTKIVQDKKQQLALQAHKIQSMLSAKLIKTHHDKLKPLLQCFQALKHKLKIRFIIKGSEIYFPGSGKDLDVYVAIEPEAHNALVKDKDKLNELLSLLEDRGFIISQALSGSMVLHEDDDKTKSMRYKVSHPSSSLSLDLAIIALPLEINQATAILAAEWRFNLSSGYALIYLDDAGEIQPGPFFSPPILVMSLFKPLNEGKSISLTKMTEEAMNHEDLAYLLKLCCKLNINITTGNNAEGIEIDGVTYKVALIPALHEEIYQVLLQDKILRPAFIKILNCFFYLRSQAFHNQFLELDLLSKVFNLPKGSFNFIKAEKRFSDKLSSQPLNGRAYLALILFEFSKTLPDPSSFNFDEMLTHLFGYTPLDISLIFASLNNGYILGSIQISSFVEESCLLLGLKRSRLNPLAMEYIPTLSLIAPSDISSISAHPS